MRNEVFRIPLLLLLALPATSFSQATFSWDSAVADDVSTLGWSKESLAEIDDYLESLGTASMMIVTRNQIVLTRGNISQPYIVRSIRKSYLSALLGIAIDRGHIKRSDSLADLGVDDIQPLSPTERAATVLQLMQARSGVYHPAAAETREAVRARPARGSHKPGTFWYYNNWDFNVLGTIYMNATGKDIGESFYHEIAEPIGMDDFKPTDTKHDVEADRSLHGAYKFRMSARDLARFGLLYLHDGKWGSKQVLPSGWVAESTRMYSETNQSGTKSGYGLMWWVTADGNHGLPVKSYTASGSRGQRLTIIPSIETIVVHLMDTNRRGGPRIGTRKYNQLISKILSARTL